jgi:chemotaxis protein methyltransferase CheR
VNPVADFLSERIGLRLDGTAGNRLERIVREGSRRARCPEGRYRRLLAENPARAQELIDAATVQESSFFRHQDQFAFLSGHLRALPAPGVIWSAGCANGQEPWSLAMLLEEKGLAGWSVLATDVSTKAVAHAAAGVYEERQLRGLDATRRRRFFTDAGPGRLAVSARLRVRVRFQHHNLVATPPPAEAGPCQVVLCRNVFIYLHRQATATVLEGLRRRMGEGALLLVGAGEAVGALPGFRAGPVPGAFLHAPVHRAPEVTKSPPLPPVSRLLAEGARLAAAGDLEGAADCYRRAGFLEPGDPRARSRLASVLERIVREA